MAGNPDPVTSIAGIATNDNVSKADFVSFEKGNVHGFTAAEVPNYDLAGRNFILVDGAVYSKDTTDTVSPAGTSVLIDANGIRFKRNVVTGKRIQARVATTANITIATALNNGDSLNGVTLVDGDIVMVKNQTAQAENGVYVVGAVPARHPDFATYNAHAGALVGVTTGTTDPSTLWFCSANEGGTLGTTAIVFGKIAFVAGGDVLGPAISTDSNFVAFSGTTGKQIKDSGVSVAAVQALLALYPESEVSSIGPDDYFRFITPDGSFRKIKTRFVLWPLQPYLGTLELEDGSGNVLDDGSGNNLAQF